MILLDTLAGWLFRRAAVLEPAVQTTEDHTSMADLARLLADEQAVEAVPTLTSFCSPIE